MVRPTGSVILYLGLVFLSGVVVGGLGYRFVNRDAAQTPASPQEMRRRYENEMRTRLKLRPDQLQKFDAILEATGKRFTELRKKLHPELDALQKQQIESIKEILDDQQRLEYDKLRDERDKERRRRGSHPGR